MKRKTKTARETPPSLTQTAEFAVREILRRLAPPEEARRDFQSARLEVLKGMRALLDARIERRSKRIRGEPIEVE